MSWQKAHRWTIRLIKGKLNSTLYCQVRDICSRRGTHRLSMSPRTHMTGILTKMRITMMKNELILSSDVTNSNILRYLASSSYILKSGDLLSSFASTHIRRQMMISRCRNKVVLFHLVSLITPSRNHGSVFQRDIYNSRCLSRKSNAIQIHIVFPEPSKYQNAVYMQPTSI